MGRKSMNKKTKKVSAKPSKTETLGFETEVTQLLKLMVHSLYSNKQIFLRELLSNASDACDKIRFEALQDETLFEDDPELQIEVGYDVDKKTIMISENFIDFCLGWAILISTNSDDSLTSSWQLPDKVI